MIMNPTWCWSDLLVRHVSSPFFVFFTIQMIWCSLCYYNSPKTIQGRGAKMCYTQTQWLLSQVPDGCWLMIAARCRWIARRCLTSEAKANPAILQAQQCRHSTAWHAAGPLCVSHIESPGEYFLPLLITGLHLLALRNQQPGFIDLP